MGFDFDILYKPGCENKAADGLSRSMSMVSLLLTLTVPTTLQWQDLYKQISDDAGIRNLISQVPEKGTSVKGKLMVRDGRLWSKKRLVIPKTSQFISLILAECHNSKMDGHSGVLKTIKRIHQSFTWEGLKKQVQGYVATCQICQIISIQHCLLLVYFNCCQYRIECGRMLVWTSLKVCHCLEV